MIKNVFFKNILVLASGTAIGQLVVILASPLLTRIYSPSEFGVLAIYSSILNIIVIVSSLRYELAIPLPKNDYHAKLLFSVSFQINLFFSILTLILVFFLSKSISIWTNTPGLEKHLWLLSIGVLLLGSYKALNYWAIRRKHFKRITKTKLYQSIASSIIQVLSGLIGMGSVGLIIGQIMGQSTGIFILSKDSNFGVSIFNFKYRLKSKLLLLKEYRNFALIDTPASILNVISLELPQLLFASLFNPAIAGFYLLSQKVLGYPLRIIGQSISQVLYGDIGDHIQKGTLSKITLRIMSILSGLTVLPCLLIFIWGADLFGLIFGNEWYEAGKFASVLIFSISARFVYSPISLILLATNGQKVNFILQLIMVILNLTAFYLGWTMNDSYKTVILLSLFNSVIYIVGIFVIYRRTLSIHK